MRQQCFFFFRGIVNMIDRGMVDWISNPVYLSLNRDSACVFFFITQVMHNADTRLATRALDVPRLWILITRNYFFFFFDTTGLIRYLKVRPKGI